MSGVLTKKLGRKYSRSGSAVNSRQIVLQLALLLRQVK